MCDTVGPLLSDLMIDGEADACGAGVDAVAMDGCGRNEPQWLRDGVGGDWVVRVTAGVGGEHDGSRGIVEDLDVDLARAVGRQVEKKSGDRGGGVGYAHPDAVAPVTKQCVGLDLSAVGRARGESDVEGPSRRADV